MEDDSVGSIYSRCRTVFVSSPVVPELPIHLLNFNTSYLFHLIITFHYDFISLA